MTIDLPKARLADYCKANGIQRLSVFGSALGPAFRDESDIDLLVEFTPGARVGFFDMARMERELSQLVGRKVDLRTAAELSRYFRADVLAEAQVQFAQE